jgi:hypothetical protein
MWIRLLRVIGLILTGIGAVIFAYLGRMLISLSERWERLGVSIGMPAMLLLTLLAAALVWVGVWAMRTPHEGAARDANDRASDTR